MMANLFEVRFFVFIFVIKEGIANLANSGDLLEGLGVWQSLQKKQKELAKDR